ncbi:hypothetical protein EYR36_002764 [Pleurotus pulmonarius]|nr:hypothetical protein EYR36_002764 [Pleurotus pulmonarius]
MASNARISSEGSPVAQTPLATTAQRVGKPSTPGKKVYRVGSKAIILDPHKRVGTITNLTNSGATIKIDADGSVVRATLDSSGDFWYPKRTATLYFPGVPGANVTMAHVRLPHTVQAPKPVPREALGSPPLPEGACDSDAADENNATTYTGTRAASSFSAHNLKSEDNITKESATFLNPTGATVEGSGNVVSNCSGYYPINGGNNTVQLPQPPAPQVVYDGHQPAVYYYDQRYGYYFAPQYTAQGAAPGATHPQVVPGPQQPPMLYQVPTPQIGSPLAPYSAAQWSQGPPAPSFGPSAAVTPTGYPQTNPQDFQGSPYAMDARSRQDTSIASSSRGPGTYSQHPQYLQ